MTNDHRSLFVPLRSSAHQLLAGAPAAAMRRKLKYASHVYEHIYVEGGSLHIYAGDGGSSVTSLPEAPEFQTARARSVAMRSGGTRSELRRTLEPLVAPCTP